VSVATLRAEGPGGGQGDLPGHDAPRQVAVSTALPWDGLHAQDPFGRILTIDPILKLEYINRFKFFLHFQKGKNIF
jgi:hypothetical protein